MTKLLVISDTHGDILLADKVLKKNSDVDIVIHLGDYYRDADKLKQLHPNFHFEYVYGNCDFMTGNVLAEKILEIERQRVLLTHGHRYSVKWGIEKLVEKANNENINLILFGHTHIQHVTYGPGYILLNPGSISEPRGNDKKSYAVVTIDNEKIDVEMKNAV
ncbi:phosphodiesterase, MJ0936 family [Thermoclostridium stercorarium subsp. stercorarium DSM 8532]|jgi:putative phosphoesterase|uniref:Phosphoesterase n=3 Tax=Thermoclostridium stercorarium TaxID=1510 RepID=L7VNI6_THES1|nr:metallophosphoesterase [Thermoclostridium stercorarium]AGC68332.1 phosphodiesterase, MJ0936 family [Thermoclostridium stercorarium subsp. stercorarium DSM 8532]AGI39356.1 phosphoesterase [Thermoclostridium stercorarium subsp. stercorarium DSM 8532]ANW98677.1 phosphodiesterase [Thermoclostridium stercorarium subsp. thermolacticum DSM 2910]ANX01218.1 phosphodiesterase [Thermoclostridium stercorarium subsp. leptospartum DSM 9219]UZQ86838.1 metallophosphoesterase [Thermoclostridium stercorarium